jgi:hypothetical protein
MTLTETPTPEQRVIDVDHLFRTVTENGHFSAKEADRFIAHTINAPSTRWAVIGNAAPSVPTETLETLSQVITNFSNLARHAVSWAFDTSGPMEHNAIMGTDLQKGDLTIWTNGGPLSPPLWITAPITLIRHDSGSTRAVSQPRPGTMVTGSSTEFQVTTYTGRLITHLTASVLAHLCRQDFVTTMTTRQEAWKYTADLAFLSIPHRFGNPCFGITDIGASQVSTLVGFLRRLTLRPEIAPMLLETLPINLAGACPGDRLEEAAEAFRQWAVFGNPDTYASEVIAPFVEPGTSGPQFVAQIRMTIDAICELAEEPPEDDETPTWGDVSLPWYGDHIRRIQLPQIHGEISALLELMIQRINQANPTLSVGCGQRPTEALTWEQAQDLAVRVLAEVYCEDGVIMFTPSSEIIQDHIRNTSSVLTTWPHNLSDAEARRLTSVCVANLIPEVTE